MTPTTTPTADTVTPARPTTPPAVAPPAESGPPARPRTLTQEQADRWAGKHIAWARDGVTIVAGTETGEALVRELTRLGIHPSRVVFDYADEPGVSYL